MDHWSSPAPSWLRGAFGFLALFSGVALLLTIIGDVDLRLGFAATTSIMLVAVFVIVRGASPEDRRLAGRSLRAGVISGVVATISYDVAKYLLAQLDPSPFDPFHAVHVFGTYLVGAGAPAGVIDAAGIAFHFTNGTAFGVAYAFLFAANGAISMRRALLTGLGWGLFLETFQITLYPGWLDIRAYQEFVLISASAHLVYGATLGALARRLLIGTGREGKHDDGY